MSRTKSTFFVDAAPVRAHIKALGVEGMSQRQVAESSGVRLSTVSTIMYGRKNSPLPRRVHVMTAKRLLAVRLSLADLPDRALVNATATARKLEALMAIGWSQRKIAGLLGVDQLFVRRAMNSKRVNARFAREVDALYERMWNTPPVPRNALEKAHVDKTVRFAQARGFRRPMDWDDINDLDEPMSVDCGEILDEVAIRRVIDGHGDPSILTAAERKEAARVMVAKGVPLKQIEDCLRMSYVTVKRAVAA